MKRLLLLFFFCAATAIGYVAWWANTPFATGNDEQEFAVLTGMGANSVARSVGRMGAGSATVNEWLFWSLIRASGSGKSVKAGTYSLVSTDTPVKILAKLTKGEYKLVSVTFVEGWTYRQVLAALALTPGLRRSALTDDASALMNAIGKPGLHPEGQFFPETYAIAVGASDVDVLKVASNMMDKKLAAAWALRDAATPLKTKHEALVLASIVEKETGKAGDRAQIAGVFVNRLRLGMMLQTDPTVIYGLGPDFDGNLRKVHLRTDTEYNTYTRFGLPPTPIAAPGWASLLAAVNPQETRAIYFVARGDGSSQFSSTLAEHNRAVNKYQRGL